MSGLKPRKGANVTSSDSVPRSAVAAPRMIARKSRSRIVVGRVPSKVGALHVHVGGSGTNPGPTQPGHLSLEIDEPATANGQRQVGRNEKERIRASSAPDPQRR